MKIVYALLALALIRNILLYKTYRSIPLLELKRRARQHDKKASALYRVASYGEVFYLRQWLFCTAAGTVLVIWSTRTNWWLATIVLVVLAWLVARPRFSAEGWAGRLAAFFVPFDAKILALLNPLLAPIARRRPRRRRAHPHTGLYEKRDLLEFLTKQNRQTDNRIAEADLQIAFNAIQFGDKTAGQVMTPRRKVKLVNASDSIGPLLMDELHKSGFSRFPVVKDSAKSATPEIIGTLYLNNLIGYEGGGKVKDLARHDVYFINESANLRQALNAFLKTHHHLLIVVNGFEEMVGVLSLEDVLEQIIGKQILDEFENYQDRRAVAAQDAKKGQTAHAEARPEQTAESVVE